MKNRKTILTLLLAFVSCCGFVSLTSQADESPELPRAFNLRSKGVFHVCEFHQETES